jgi:protein SCO1/2
MKADPMNIRKMNIRKINGATMRQTTSSIAALLLLFWLPLSSCSRDNHLSNRPDQTDSASHQAKAHASGPSLYQLEGNWTTQDNRVISLTDLKGRVQLVAMVFTNCKYACPKIIAEMKEMESRLPQDKRSQIGFVLVSFDVDRDTPDRLKEFAREMNMDDRWTLLHGDEQQVRELSVLLNVKYEKYPGGDFAHSSVVTVLDTDGAVVTRLEGLKNDQGETIQAIRSLLE